MTQDRATPQNEKEAKASQQQVLAASYYGLLGLHPSASVREIRQAYRDLSKLYHPDTTALAAAIAITKFQQINEAYATLSSPERRTAYDQKIGYSSVPVVQRSLRVEQANASTRTVQSSSAYLDSTDRPLSPGEIFALFILGITFVGCLVLAIAIGITRGEAVFQPLTAHLSAPQQEITSAPNAPQLSAPQQEATVAPSTPRQDVTMPTNAHEQPLTNQADVPAASPPASPESET
ncbi:J domain-containing protein [Stenomitos frigidus]|uniref:Molecular chaperone DnaJ n=1 Tax=Stenomitos frigidus ULC18 TaxID=2107698 RepID=A0A2T1EGJ0_9CYAN|nr:J domain-containing protein [Stenomitos frigidus]PSB31849.1 molecular chaperone DnaJ [Stenomitos frigidus ULC18]